MGDHDAVWAQTTDGGLLQQLFGYYPTLHDATVRGISMGGHPLSVTIVVDYTDRVETPGRHDDLTARIRLIWGGVHRFELPLGDDDLFGLQVGQDGDRIHARLEVYPGVYGQIVSDTFEVVLMQIDPGPRDDTRWIRYTA